MVTRIAITRQVSPAIDKCELTHLKRRRIDLVLARSQHHRYEECLAALGCEVCQLPAEPDLPDSVFVEDSAVVLDEVAVIARPGAESRQAETESIAAALKAYRKLCRITPPGTLDGGDVLRVGRRIFIGQSSRTNRVVVDQVRSFLDPLGYEVEAVQVKGCLHLKSAVTQVARDSLLFNPAWVDAGVFDGLELIEVDPAEPLAGNALLVGDTVVYSSAFPATRRRLQDRGIPVQTVEVSELEKAEGGVTCCSLIFSQDTS